MILAERIPAKIRHYLIIVLVFTITGSIAVLLSNLILSNALGLEGSLWSGPWGFRIAYLLLIPPSYSVMLIAVGTLFGKRAYFTGRVIRIWGRPLRLIRVLSTINRM